jgi:hypothetical protein
MKAAITGFSSALISILLAAAILAAGAACLADGGVFYSPPSGTSQPVDMESQLAAIAVKDTGEWDLYIQISYSGDPADFGWVVPFPQLPQVDERPVDTDFFKDLDTMTATYFVTEGCYHGGCGGNDIGFCGTAAGDAGYQDETAGSKVTVWRSGEIGILEYVIVSSGDGESIVEWLETNGFVVRASAEPIIQQLASERTYFFAARIGIGVSSVKTLTPVRFTLTPPLAPFYPMRLTAVSGGETVKFTLWILDERGRSFTPSNYPWDFIQGEGSLKDEMTQTAYSEAAESLLSSGSRDIFIIDFSTDSGQERSCTSFHGESLTYSYMIPADMCSYAPLSTEMRTMGSWGITRMHAEIPPAALLQDVMFSDADAGELLGVRSWFWAPCADTSYTCSDEDKYSYNCSVPASGGTAGSKALVPFVLLFALTGLALGLRGLVRKRGR